MSFTQTYVVRRAALLTYDVVHDVHNQKRRSRSPASPKTLSPITLSFIGILG